jgi:quercetin dioxygenase-like cupin family protein
MHTSDTIDVGVILDGDIFLELDDGAETHLHAGDVVVQNGTRHAWHNRTGQPCRMLFAIVGAHSPAAPSADDETDVPGS